MRPDRLTSLLLAAALVSAADAAQAQTAAARMQAAAFRTSAAQATAATPVAFDLPAAARSEPQRPFGIAKTAIDHRFDRRDVDGSVGFLCGLQPKADTNGAAAAYGVDPQGRFLGVKLHLTFR